MSSTDDTDDARQSAIVVDGAERLAEGVRSAVLPTIQTAVIAEYSDRLAAAGFLRRIWLRWCMKAEIDRRVEAEIANNMPSDETLH